METLTYDEEITALLVIDPYNDFISEGGKVWDRLKGVAEANKCVPHKMQVLDAARKADIRVFYTLHHRYRPANSEGSLVAQDLRAALDVNIPNYASAIVTTNEVGDSNFLMTRPFGGKQP